MADSILRIGPAGWAYPDWKGIVYPDPMPKGLHPLELLCEAFDTVEINASFYRPPAPNHGEIWLKKVEKNPNFRFTAKLWERFTHRRSEWPSGDEIAPCKAGIAPLHDAGKLGAILVQFPWSFRRTPDNRRWLARIIETFHDYPLALEVRHTSWEDPAFFDGLRERNIAFCNIDQPLLNDCIAPSAHATATFAYVRLHGRRYDTWFDNKGPSFERYNYLYNGDELDEWARRVRDLETHAAETYLVTNNHYQGKSIINALQLSALLQKDRGTLQQVNELLPLAKR